jgi:hypothetical protein
LLGTLNAIGARAGISYSKGRDIVRGLFGRFAEHADEKENATGLTSDADNPTSS